MKQTTSSTTRTTNVKVTSTQKSTTQSTTSSSKTIKRDSTTTTTPISTSLITTVVTSSTTTGTTNSSTALTTTQSTSQTTTTRTSLSTSTYYKSSTTMYTKTTTGVKTTTQTRTTTAAQKGLPFNYKVCDSSWSCSDSNTRLVVNGGSFDFTGVPVTSKSSSTLQVDGPSGMMLVKPSGTSHDILYLKNKVLWITSDISKVQCGYNAAFYLVNMPVSAAPGTGYCDAQNTCMEVDILESNVGGISGTSHSCVSTSSTPCDPIGCGYKSRVSLWDQIGVGKNIDTLKPFTIATEFITNDGTDTGSLVSIKQTIFQGSHVFYFNQWDDVYCTTADPTYWSTTGGLQPMSKALDIGMTLLITFWGNGANSMSWLDLQPGNVDCNSGVGYNRAFWSNMALTRGPVSTETFQMIQSLF
ncbi:glycoside hydrolase family 7 protein [Gonapodya prolifera JEL478]|uniref:cellulose 1,4-beta-cellobiosidase (non-reducing end) n=1 Tax=Gonapodya prolifera (strain JEL478) TaxID=1344416 RepID=A0A138ZXK2_GONPJ|nr:glycoside hydrolase family 7 protein [Gonapodya prolifera JEL478]|eukprot:KXS08863.1 glycoside hydrolase family 7 protein [Gonapodya prolifera JEL478]